MEAKLRDGRCVFSLGSISLFSVEVYNLTEEIEQAGEFTVFAPTDAAIEDYLERMSVAALVGGGHHVTIRLRVTPQGGTGGAGGHQRRHESVLGCFHTGRSSMGREVLVPVRCRWVPLRVGLDWSSCLEEPPEVQEGWWW